MMHLSKFDVINLKLYGLIVIHCTFVLEMHLLLCYIDTKPITNKVYLECNNRSYNLERDLLNKMILELKMLSDKIYYNLF